MRRNIIIASAALLISAAASAQNLNPTVQVTNTYEGKLMEVAKQDVAMAVPDSLLKFDWDFNYSVFDNPYKGAYEFTPYLIEMRPEPTAYDGRNFYLRAGAGYSLHPEAQMYWTPNIKGPFGLTIYDDFKGYWGNYEDIRFVSIGDEYYRTHAEGIYDASDMKNRGGFTARYDGKAFAVTLDGRFDWLRTTESGFSGNNALTPSATLRVRSNGPSKLYYDVSADYSQTFNSFNISYTAPWYSSYRDPNGTTYNLMELEIGGSATLGYKFASHHAVQIGASYDHINFSEPRGLATAHWVNVAPAYKLSLGKFNASLGAKYSQIWKDFSLKQSYASLYVDEDGNIVFPLADYQGKRFYPDVKLSYELVDEALVVSAAVTGGQKYNTYSSRLDANHHLPYEYSLEYTEALGDATVNTFDASLGFSGRVLSRMQYKLDAGYARYYNAPLEGIRRFMDNFYLSYYMSNYDVMYAEFNGSWASDRLDASARLRLQKSMLNAVSTAISSPRFVGSANVTYNFNRRIYIGASAEWLTNRKYAATYEYSIDQSFSCEIPGWVDLGASLEFKATNKFSIWAKGGNLLNQTIMRNFLFAESGPYGTAGICLNF